MLAVSLLCAKPRARCWGTEGEKGRGMDKDATVTVIRAHSLSTPVRYVISCLCHSAVVKNRWAHGWGGTSRVSPGGRRVW